MLNLKDLPRASTIWMLKWIDKERSKQKISGRYFRFKLVLEKLFKSYFLSRVNENQVKNMFTEKFIGFHPPRAALKDGRSSIQT